MKVLVGFNPMDLGYCIPDLKEKHPDVEFAHCVDRDVFKKEISDTEIYLGWISREEFLAAEQLRWIQSPSSGVDSFLKIPELVEGPVYLTSASGTHGACLAESTMGMILAFTRGIRDCVLAQQQRSWEIGRKARPRLLELTGSTMGIIGLGRVGRALAKRAHAFDLRIIAVDMYPENKPDYVSELWGLDRLDDLLKESDYVVVAVPGTPETKGMLGAEQIALMKSGAMLVVISRGGIVDQKALAQALREKHLAAAALDVFDPEPLPEDDELWELDNLIMTPHIAGGTNLEGKYIVEIFRENLERFLNHDFPLRNQVGKKRGF